MDTATPIASRGHFTTLTTGSVGARCLKFPSMPHPVTGVRLYAYGRPMHVQPQSSQLQLPDTTVVPSAPVYAARSA